MKESATDTIDKFWSWFIRNEVDLSETKTNDSTLLNRLRTELKAVNPGFFYEFSTNTVPREFIVTAGGNRDLFGLVEEFVSSAPRIPAWKIIALKPAKGFGFVTNYEGVDYDPKSMWFLPLVRKDGKLLPMGLRLGIPDLKAANMKPARFAAFVILDTCLGERSSVDDIDYVDVALLPPDAEKKGYIELTELPDYIQWRKRNAGKTDPSTSSG
jgi:hypothetical protein